MVLFFYVYKVRKAMLVLKRILYQRYIYITILREPVARYLSEWLHVSRGATWDRAYLLCNGEEYDYPFCYEGNLKVNALKKYLM